MIKTSQTFSPDSIDRLNRSVLASERDARNPAYIQTIPRNQAPPPDSETEYFVYSSCKDDYLICYPRIDGTWDKDANADFVRILKPRHLMKAAYYETVGEGDSASEQLKRYPYSTNKVYTLEISGFTASKSIYDAITNTLLVSENLVIAPMLQPDFTIIKAVPNPTTITAKERQNVDGTWKDVEVAFDWLWDTERQFGADYETLVSNGGV